VRTLKHNGLTGSSRSSRCCRKTCSIADGGRRRSNYAWPSSPGSNGPIIAVAVNGSLAGLPPSSSRRSKHTLRLLRNYKAPMETKPSADPFIPTGVPTIGGQHVVLRRNGVRSTVEMGGLTWDNAPSCDEVPRTALRGSALQQANRCPKSDSGQSPEARSGTQHSTQQSCRLASRTVSHRPV
jgi:hypothetical protein